MSQLTTLVTDPAMWPVFGITLLAGFARGLTGFGVALIMLPLGAAVLGPRVIIPVMAIIDLPTAVWLAWSVRHDFDRREIAVLIPAALIGTPLGVAVLRVADAGVMKIAASIIVLAFSAALAAGFKFKGEPSRKRSAAIGLIAGFMDGAVGLPGPPLVLGWLAAQVPGPKLRANVVVIFAALTLIVVPAFAVGGLITPHVLQAVLVIIPFFITGVIAGKTASGRVPETIFRRIVLGIVTIGAVTALVN